MKTFSLYVGYDSLEPIKKCEATSHVQAANYFRDYVRNELGKESLYGFCIKRDDLQLTGIEHDLHIEVEAYERMRKGSEELGYVVPPDEKCYVIVNKDAFQPAIRVNDNTFKVTFIMK